MNRLVQSELLEHVLSAIKPSNQDFKSAPWLRCDFNNPIWKTSFFDVNFGVRLPDQTSLSDTKNLPLCTSLKTFLIIQTHPALIGSKVYTDQTSRVRLTTAVQICERLLLQAQEYGLHLYGLQAITRSQSLELIKNLCCLEAHDGVYGWTSRLTTFLSDCSSTLNASELAEALSIQPDIQIISAKDFTLKLTKESLIKARAWLWLRGFYKYGAGIDGYRFILDSTKLASHIYPNGTLRSTWAKPYFEELSITKAPTAEREYPGVPVRGEKRGDSAPRFVIKALSSLELLKKADLEVPAAILASTKNLKFIEALDLEPPGRYRTVPHGVVITSFRNAVEFSLEYAEDLLAAYEKCASAATAARIPIGKYLENRSIAEFISPKLAAFGISVWSIGLEERLAFRYRRQTRPPENFEEYYFSQLRSNCGLWDLLMVLGGCYLVMLGTLMARRQGELLDLEIGSMLSRLDTHLSFAGRKTGVGSMRRTLQRPIPKFLSRLLKLLEKFQKSLLSSGVITSFARALAFPNEYETGLAKSGDSQANYMLDRFCDYFQLALDSIGSRYYLRQHQLRRFFAMLFFWGNSFSGLDTLRWFLGQTDAEHLYNYITEVTPGDVLRSVKADFVVERAFNGDPMTAALLDVVFQEFGTRNILLLDVDEVAEFINGLIADGRVRVEPKFMRGPHETSYQVIISIAKLAAETTYD